MKLKLIMKNVNPYFLYRASIMAGLDPNVTTDFLGHVQAMFENVLVAQTDQKLFGVCSDLLCSGSSRWKKTLP